MSSRIGPSCSGERTGAGLLAPEVLAFVAEVTFLTVATSLAVAAHPSHSRTESLGQHSVSQAAVTHRQALLASSPSPSMSGTPGQGRRPPASAGGRRCRGGHRHPVTGRVRLLFISAWSRTCPGRPRIVGSEPVLDRGDVGHRASHRHERIGDRTPVDARQAGRYRLHGFLRTPGETRGRAGSARCNPRRRRRR